MAKLFLYGPPASGKSTLGKVIATRFTLPFIDLDDAITSAASCSIPTIFKDEGEEGFRRRESDALQQVTAMPEQQIIALGGGTLLTDSNRQQAENNGVVLCFNADEEELARRIARRPGMRPLGLSRLRERAPHYASFPNRLDAHFALDTPDGMSDIFVGRNLMGLVPLLAPHNGATRCVVVADENTVRYAEPIRASLAAEGFAVTLHTISAGESHKTLATVQNIWRTFLTAGLGRKDFAVAVGGGIVSDLTGFAAATWMRGITWLNVPTTLLAMVDASTGGKTGCDLPEGKNLIGAFHSPRVVIADAAVLATLPEREMRCGMAESIKHAIISGRRDAASRIAASLSVKVEIVRKDAHEQNIRAQLNLGHTIGHAIEIATNFALAHGEAVAIGTCEEARLAARLNLAPTDWPEKVVALFAAANLPTALPDGITFDSLIPLMRRDKKNAEGKIVFALPVALGDVRVVPVSL